MAKPNTLSRSAQARQAAAARPAEAKPSEAASTQERDPRHQADAADNGLLEGDAPQSPSVTAIYRVASPGRCIWQIASTFIPLLAVLTVMYLSLGLSYALVLVLAVPAAGLVVRVFAIQHDCGHGSFLPSHAANAFVGRLCSLATLTPFANWRRHHLLHHLNWNNLDRRESGMDIYGTCLTVAEYRKLSRWRRLQHRLVQHPLIAQVLLPPLIFVALYRIPFDTPPTWGKERRSVWLTNGALAILYLGLGWAVGFRDMILVQAPIIGLAGILGVWLFSLQHRFKGAIWMRGDVWSPAAASFAGSSFVKLPKVAQWLTGNIGFHHIHHFDSRIPNYRLEECHNGDAAMRAVTTLSLRDGLVAWRYALWDEVAGRMVRFADVAA